jgi:hypothetical protein
MAPFSDAKAPRTVTYICTKMPRPRLKNYYINAHSSFTVVHCKPQSRITLDLGQNFIPLNVGNELTNLVRPANHQRVKSCVGSMNASCHSQVKTLSSNLCTHIITLHQNSSAPFAPRVAK